MQIIFAGDSKWKMKNASERIAIIDMGTNTFHLLIAEIGSQNSFTIILNEKTAVKLGEGGISDGFISEEAQSRALTALKKYRIMIEHNSVNYEKTYATSALRSARNSSQFIDKINKETKFLPHIISGLEEAKFIYFGVRAGLKLTDKPDLILDIGGGSIEFIIADKNKIFWRRSYEIGAQRLKDRFHTSEPIPDDQLTALEAFLSGKLKSVVHNINKYKPKSLIGVAGTFDTLSEIYEIGNNVNTNPEATEGPFSIKAFESIRMDLTVKTLAERIKTPGLIEFRAGMIVVAMAVIHWVLKQNNFNKVRISRYSLKEGILYSITKNLQ